MFSIICVCIHTHTHMYIHIYIFCRSLLILYANSVGIMHWNYVLSVYDLSFDFMYGILYRLVFQLMYSKALIFSFLLYLICTLRRLSRLKVK